LVGVKIFKGTVRAKTCQIQFVGVYAKAYLWSLWIEVNPFGVFCQRKMEMECVYRMEMEKMGEWAFLLFVILAIFAGIAIGAGLISTTEAQWITLTMMIVGIIVGLVTITKKETSPFLIAAIALMAVSIRGETFTNLNLIIDPLGSVLDAVVVNITAFVAPAAVIIAIKAVYAMASSR